MIVNTLKSSNNSFAVLGFKRMELKSSLWSQTIERSRIPDECLTEDVIVGIDEAGRGPVMGMYYYFIVI